MMPVVIVFGSLFAAWLLWELCLYVGIATCFLYAFITNPIKERWSRE